MYSFYSVIEDINSIRGHSNSLQQVEDLLYRFGKYNDTVMDVESDLGQGIEIFVPILLQHFQLQRQMDIESPSRKEYQLPEKPKDFFDSPYWDRKRERYLQIHVSLLCTSISYAF